LFRKETKTAIPPNGVTARCVSRRINRPPDNRASISRGTGLSVASDSILLLSQILGVRIFPRTSEFRLKSDMDVKTAIRNGDAGALRRLLAEDASRANALIAWGRDDCILTHPLHYVSDMLFQGKMQKGQELPLIEALIQAGADLDFQRDGKGDTPLIGAASLGA